MRPASNSYSLGLTASYTLDFFGKNHATAVAAKLTAKASHYDRDVIILSTEATLADTYFTLLAAQDQLSIAQNNVKSPASPEKRSRPGSMSAPPRRSTSPSSRASWPRNKPVFRRCGRQSSRARMPSPSCSAARPRPSISSAAASTKYRTRGQGGPALGAAAAPARRRLGRNQARRGRCQCPGGARGVLSVDHFDRRYRLFEYYAAKSAAAGSTLRLAAAT